MSLLSYVELVELVERKVITNVEHDFINATTIDITIGRMAKVEASQTGQKFFDNPLKWLISLCRREPMQMIDVDLREGVKLHPGQCLLACSEQMFNLPNDISAEYVEKSSMGRIFLNHMKAGWCDAGWNGSVLTLELKNDSQFHYIEIKEGDRIGQMKFYRHTPVPEDRSYSNRGRYNNDSSVQGVKE